MPNITTLKNGFRIASDQMKEIETISICFSVGAGSRMESAQQNGISHFLEHMAFKGTDTRSAQQIAEEFDSIGGYLNAYTSRETTVYYAKVLKEDKEKSFDIIADIVQNSVFDEAEMEKERQVILQEIAENNDDPDDLVHDYFQEQAFPNQPIGRSILGTEELVSNFGRNDLVDYINSKYLAKDVVLSVVGNIEHQEVLDLSVKYFSKIKDGNNPSAEKAIYSGGFSIKPKELEQAHILIGFPGFSYHDAEFYPNILLGAVLGGGMSSRLFQEVREKRGLAYSIYAYATSYFDNGIFSIYSSTTPDKIKELVQLLKHEINILPDNIQQKELDRAKAQIKSSILMGQESSSSRAEDLGRHLINYNRHIPIEEIIGKINKVEIADLKDAANKIFMDKKPTISAVGAVNNIKEEWFQ